MYIFKPLLDCCLSIDMHAYGRQDMSSFENIFNRELFKTTVMVSVKICKTAYARFHK